MTIEPTIAPQLLSKAVLRVAAQLGLADDLPALLMIDADAAQKLQAGVRSLQPGTSEWSRAQQLVGLFRTLLSVLVTEERARAWLVEQNQTLGARPADLLRTADAERVHRYVTAVLKHELRMPPSSREDADG